jgi:ABC-type multidrug transport system fused ATPase/permease subunit
MYTYIYIYISGNIRVGGIDTKTIGLHKLRRAMAIIPQEPQLFAGPLRAVLDPFDEFDDACVWACLQQVCMCVYVLFVSFGVCV